MYPELPSISLSVSLRSYDTSAAYRTLCETLGVTQSIVRTGVCWDNALAEWFFAK